MGRRLRALALAGALIAASAGLAATTAAAAASAPPLSTGTLQSSNLFGKLKIDFTGNCCQDGTVGTSYSQEFTATGGGGLYVWSIAKGQLPPGLQIFTGYTGGHPGFISGTPTAAGTFGFVVQVKSFDGQTADLNGKITIH